MTARVWDVTNGNQLVRHVGDAGPLRAVAFSPDGDWVAAAGANGETRIWEWEKRKLLAVMKMHADLINSLVFTRDQRILTASDDWTAKIYRCDTCVSLDELKRIARERVAGE